jgi:hypothetical protein
MVLSFGIYLPFWGMRLARDMRKRFPKISHPGMYFLGWLLGLSAPFVAYTQGSQIRRLNMMAGQPPAPNPTLLLGLFLLTFVSGFLLKDDPGPVWLLHFLVLVPAPVLLMQRAVNRYKLTLTEPRWSSPPFRFTRLQYLLLALGLIVSILVVVGSVEIWSRSRGETLAAGQVVRGDSGLYTLKIPSSDWKAMPAGEFDEDADLSLYGPTVDTWVVAFVDRGPGWDLDASVDARRDLIVASDLEVREERRLLPGTLIPVSYAHYRGTDPILGEQVWWVATLVTDDSRIEIVTSTFDAQADEVYLKELIMSLELTIGRPGAGG